MSRSDAPKCGATHPRKFSIATSNNDARTVLSTHRDGAEGRVNINLWSRSGLFPPPPRCIVPHAYLRLRLHRTAHPGSQTHVSLWQWANIYLITCVNTRARCGASQPSVPLARRLRTPHECQKSVCSPLFSQSSHLSVQ